MLSAPIYAIISKQFFYGFNQQQEIIYLGMLIRLSQRLTSSDAILILMLDKISYSCKSIIKYFLYLFFSIPIQNDTMNHTNFYKNWIFLGQNLYFVDLWVQIFADTEKEHIKIHGFSIDFLFMFVQKKRHCRRCILLKKSCFFHLFPWKKTFLD